MSGMNQYQGIKVRKGIQLDSDSDPDEPRKKQTGGKATGGGASC
jgi:hypothetical protein